jgi:type II pantothenate kinase
MILGIDVGGSTTKIVGLDGTGATVGMLQVEAGDQVTSAFGAFGKFIATYNLRMSDVEQIVVTGVGAANLATGMYDIPTKRADEFMAIGLGGLSLAELPEALIVSVGTGTALVQAAHDRDLIRHLGGSGVGGGMLSGMAARFAGVNGYSGLLEACEKGDPAATDLCLRHISKDASYNLPPETTVSNFGNLRDNATPADIVLGLTNLVFESIGMMAVFAVQGTPIKDIVLTGALSTLPHAAQVFATLQQIHPVRFHIPKGAIFATALGAALSEF